ncbi:MYPU_1760 family metalloprotease [Mycoplasmopsis agassizii]|uniref:Uncharacterized protein n=1 Tax=Mycoplasmopsis agassizii TaxID=33922 RepID=A0ABX4H477_9BACT|nr:hypothetical protein [Mycoplasmopsis agassizii]PAF54692.1 hypothetical protein CJF60_03055 [Mycoplasmopsis agassizii]SMC16013.1 hypothetical protein SAMN02745179_00191 [Mycoplasmopsis agassizii]
MKKVVSKTSVKVVKNVLIALSSIFVAAIAATTGAIIIVTTGALKGSLPIALDPSANGSLVTYSPKSPFSSNSNWSVATTVQNSAGAATDVPATNWIQYDSFASRLTNGSEKWFFSKEELADLHKIILDRLAYGPEIYDLKRISFNNVDILSSGVNGQYFPATNEIFISVNSYIMQDMTFEQKVDAVLPTIYHEYFHHFANSYLQSDNLNQITRVNNTTLVSKAVSTSASGQNNVTVSASQWNKNFVDEFQQLLNYENTADNNALKSEHLRSWVSAAGPRQCLCAVYAASVLYAMANENSTVANAQLQAVTNNLYVSAPEVSTTNGFRNNSAITYGAEQIAYFYSQAELVPREFQKIGYVPFYSVENPGTNFSNRFAFAQNGFGTSVSETVNTSVTNIRTYSDTYIEDLGRSNKLLSQSVNNVDVPYIASDNRGAQYLLANNVSKGSLQINNREVVTFEDRTKDLYNAYLKAMGYDNEINQIYFVNPNIAVKSLGIVQAKNPNDSVSIRDKFNNIRMSGFLTKEKAAKYDGLIIENGNKKIKVAITYLNNKNINSNKNVLTDNNDFASQNLVFNPVDNLLKDGEFTFKAKQNVSDLSKTLGPLESKVTNSTSEYVSWMSDAYFMDVSTHVSTSRIYFWDDLNNDDEVQDNEKFVPLLNNTSRTITSFRASQQGELGSRNFYTIAKDSDQQVQMTRSS